MGAARLHLFGSTARGDPNAGDLDVFVDYDPTSSFSLIDLVRIKLYLESELAVDVHLTTRDSLHPLLRSDIERSAVRVF
jgi:uncharacterized protein